MKKLDFEQMVFVPLPEKWNIAVEEKSQLCQQNILQAFSNNSHPAKDAAKNRKAKPVFWLARL